MKFHMDHYRHKSISDATFESSTFSIFGNMTSKASPLKMGASHR